MGVCALRRNSRASRRTGPPPSARADGPVAHHHADDAGARGGDGFPAEQRLEAVVDLRPIYVLLLDPRDAQVAVLDHDRRTGSELIPDAGFVLKVALSVGRKRAGEVNAIHRPPAEGAEVG